MTIGFRTVDSQGRETFNINMPVVRQELLQYIPANSSGSIDMSGYIGGSCAVRFVPATYHTFTANLTMPYAVMSGNNLNWTSAGFACYAIITGVVR